ncbi:Eukaryotic translation initiation factor 2 subunit alpha-like protein, partial [Bienertia sinuspersici]
DLYMCMGWPLYQKDGHAFEAFEMTTNDPNKILDPLTYDVKEIGPDGHEIITMQRLPLWLNVKRLLNGLNH